MEDQITSATPESSLQVPADATIGSIAEFKDRLLAAIRENQTLTLDLSQIESVDMSFFQVCCAGQRLADELGKSLTLNQESAPAAVRETVMLAGFSRNVGCSIDDESICLWKEEG
ncbi:MAG: STAS domain-containing protein [Desulfuromonadales bacterium]|nr:STAS domain-containing protein [Desulfuromonadales bacterium]NIR34044.1 STAS domain-containing protein [Desulfuromonadales bacterium]NIS44095.1 STAS domain-containing protein [Desulfuromonadales bacterium]